MMYSEIVSQVAKDSNATIESIVASDEANALVHKYWFYRYERGYSTLVENVKSLLTEGK